MLDVGCFILLFWFLRKLKGRVMSFLRMQGKKIKMIAAFFFFFFFFFRGHERGDYIKRRQ
jgi:hypothetical protein